MPKPVIRYQCEHCKIKTYSSKSNCVRHEKQCFANPKMKACRTCKFFLADMETVYNPHHNGDPGSTDCEIKVYYCTKLNKKLYDELPLQSNCYSYEYHRDNFR